jgi:hypothetical protein
VRGIALFIAKEQLIRGVQVCDATVGRRRANALVPELGQKCDEFHEVLDSLENRITPPANRVY